ncbi:type II toxin-antitoxin system HipA family toxin [Pseudomonas serbica]|uniref:type II toxin-antitoxin system HipA family toxin n=1 Tax=Pseudomonas serbica TaxID=2965074 RepID=UPI00237A79BD|nr:type II toxin-antitoxin system HipA family toxin [Pseudomonas serbica]
MKIKNLNVAVPEGPSGVLHKGSQFLYSYEGADEQAREVSLVMPSANAPFRSSTLHPIFDMNVPEGYLADQIRRRMAKHLPLDEMRMLSLIGENQIGRLTLRDPLSTGATITPQVGLKELLNEKQSAKIFEFLVDAHFASGISGVQPKVLVPDLDKQDAFRGALGASDLIVKSGSEQYHGLAQNEFLCMEAARLAGISTPAYWLSDSRELFIMERFDLTPEGLLGFEDMAVLLRLPKDQHDNYKYSQSYEVVSRVVNDLCQDKDRELEAFFASFCLSVMVRNGDAHLKNFGLLYTHPGDRASVRLSPIFDVTTTTIYDHYNPKSGQSLVDRTMALKLNGKKNYPTRQELLAFGSNQCMLRRPEDVINRIAEAMHEALRINRDRLDPSLHAAMSKEWEAGIVMALHPALGKGFRRSPVKNIKE